MQDGGKGGLEFDAVKMTDLCKTLYSHPENARTDSMADLARLTDGVNVRRSKTKRNPQKDALVTPMRALGCSSWAL